VADFCVFEGASKRRKSSHLGGFDVCPSAFQHTRIALDGSGWTRIVRLQPTMDLVGGETFEAGITTAIRIDGSDFKVATHVFQVECNPADPTLCPALTVDDPVVLPAERVPDAGVEPDAGRHGCFNGGGRWRQFWLA